MTPEEINRKLAEWAGLECDNCGTKAPDVCGCNISGIGSGSYVDYCRTNAAMDLLGMLVGKKYWYEISSHADDTHTVILGEWVDDAWEDGTSAWIRKYICESKRQPTIPAAICHACLEVAEREGEE